MTMSDNALPTSPAMTPLRRVFGATDRGVIGRWLGARYGITTAY